jgi:hypothetical protein
MPLKHWTETLLITVLALFVIFTGIMASTLPLLPEGFVPAIALLLLTLCYIGIVYPTLKSNRADYPFRLLHLAPTFFVLLWIIFAALAYRFPHTAFLHYLVRWGWMLGPVVIVFILLALFCLQVLRRWTTRLGILAVLLVPFAIMGTLTETKVPFNASVTQVVWRAPVWSMLRGEPTIEPPQIAVNTTSSAAASVQSSILRQGETWSQRLEKDHQETKKQSSSAPAKVEAPRLPKAGFSYAQVSILLIAGYCAVLHQRSKRRMKEAVSIA